MKLNFGIMKNKERRIETFESQILSADEPCEGNEIFQLFQYTTRSVRYGNLAQKLGKSNKLSSTILNRVIHRQKDDKWTENNVNVFLQKVNNEWLELQYPGSLSFVSVEDPAKSRKNGLR